jgi:hypothetical protein
MGPAEEELPGGTSVWRPPQASSDTEMAVVSMAAWPARTRGGASAPAPSPSASPSLCCRDNVRCRRHRDADPRPQVRARAAPLAPRVGAGGEAPLNAGGGRSRGGREAPLPPRRQYAGNTRRRVYWRRCRVLASWSGEMCGATVSLPSSVWPCSPPSAGVMTGVVGVAASGSGWRTSSSLQEMCRLGMQK